jgi:8-oxo-dGTP pyrophosphatase MutT (NUDIX family)
MVGRAERPDRVSAAGGVVWRHARGSAAPAPAPSVEPEPEAGVEVLLIHRPAYDDWSWPKGKPDGDEAPEQTALREVEEETGLRCRLGPELASTRYVDGSGRDKVVRYWAMTVEGQRPRPPDDEVDECRWVPADQARRLLTYPHDRDVLDSLRNVIPRA